ncbi:MAG TPA: serine/threonine-protein kinase [Kofleriaceae bacterium]|nr:serine/threonine-protein kinase [Kofleriaceae bacterium]
MDELDPQTRIGTTVADRYRIRALIGRGSMGFVYDVEDTRTGQLGALKVLLPEVSRNPEIAARLAREGKAMSLLSHRNIVALLDTGTLDDGTPFIITELAGGTSLRAVMDAGAIEPVRALRIIRQVLDALEHAHAHGIIHRDVKPENVIVSVDEMSGDDVVKVLDFGVAKLVDDTRKLLGEAKLTQVGFELFGSPHYVAPEVVVGNPVDARADLYSTGAVLFEMLAGVPPFDDPDPVALLRQQAVGATPTLAQRAPSRTFAPDLEILVADALAKDPARRFASASAMTAALDATSRSLQIGDPNATEVSPAPRAPQAEAAAARPQPPAAPATLASRRAAALQWARSHPRATRAASVGIALLVVVLAVRVLHRHPSAAQASKAAAGEPSDASALVARAEADQERGATVDAVSEYERALLQDGALATDARIRANLTKLATGKDSVAAVIALDLLARSISPPARDVIAAQASKSPSREVRQRAFAIAVRDRFLDTVSLLDSYLLDLQQAKTCDERRAIIGKLRDLGDARAAAALRRAKAQFPCIDRDATDALAALDPKP